MNAIAPMSAQSSGEIQALIDGIEREKADAGAALIRAEGERPQLLLSADDRKLDRHDADMIRHRRAIERVDLRLPALRDALSEAQSREALKRKAAQRTDVTAKIDAFAQTFAAAYEEPAKQIAAFCMRWAELDQLARDAGVEGPSSRFLATELRGEEPAQYETEEYQTYLDEFGRETLISHGTNPEGIRRREDGDKYLRQLVTRTRQVKTSDAKPALYDIAPPLTQTVNLPALAARASAFWQSRKAT